MFCPNCGTKLPDGAAFCSNCGNKIQAAPVEPVTGRAGSGACGLHDHQHHTVRGFRAHLLRVSVASLITSIIGIVAGSS